MFRRAIGLLSLAALAACDATTEPDSGPGNKWGDLSEDWVGEACNWATVAGSHFDIDYMIVGAPLPDSDRVLGRDLSYDLSLGVDSTVTLFAPVDEDWSTEGQDVYTVQDCAADSFEVQGPQWHGTSGIVHVDATFAGADATVPCEDPTAMVHYDLAVTMSDVYLETDAGNYASIDSLGPLAVELSVPFCDE
jgi:hypothetical protein